MQFSRGVRYQWGLFERKISSKSLKQFLRYWQKTKKMPMKLGFFPFVTPQNFFFKNRALSLLYPYGALTSCKKLEKPLERSLIYLKTDQQTDRHGWLNRTPSGKPWVQKWKSNDWFPRKPKTDIQTDRPTDKPTKLITNKDQLRYKQGQKWYISIQKVVKSA